jgi:putative flippase GtrA
MTPFVRFGVVGAMNIVVDLAVFNVLAATLGLGHNSFKFIIFKSISFLFALANSYLFNKIWEYQTYRSPSSRISAETSNFMMIGFLGLLVNTSVAVGIFSLGLSFILAVPAANIANGAVICAAVVTGLMNLIAYSLFVFNIKIKSAKTVVPAERKTKINIGIEQPRFRPASILHPQKS